MNFWYRANWINWYWYFCVALMHFVVSFCCGISPCLRTESPTLSIETWRWIVRFYHDGHWPVMSATFIPKIMKIL